MWIHKLKKKKKNRKETINVLTASISQLEAYLITMGPETDSCEVERAREQLEIYIKN